MSVGKVHTAEVGHRVDFDPDDVIQDPVTQVLLKRAQAIDVVVRANDTQRTATF